MKSTERREKASRLEMAVACMVFAFSCIAPANVLAEETPTLTDEQKMEQVRGYFESEYQEEDFFRTDRLLLTATGSLKPVYKAPSVASVITAEDIEKMGARTLDEVLETVAGLHVSVSNKNAIQPVYSIRGIHTSINPQVLLLLNGNPLTYTYTGGRLTTLLIPVANISRVEVVRGPGSAVHGADAFAGTINIITKDGQEIGGTHTGIRYGSFTTREAWFQHGGTYGGWDAAFNIEFLDSDGDDERVIDTDLQMMLGPPGVSLAPGPLKTWYEVFNTSLELSRGKWTSRLWYWQSNEVAIRDGVSQTLTKSGDVEAEQFLFEIVYSDGQLFRNLAMDAHVSFMYEHADHFLEIFPAGAFLPIGADGNIEFSPATDKFVLFSDGVFGNPIQKDYQYNADLAFLYTGFSKQQWRFATGVRYIEEEIGELKNFGPGVIDVSSLPSYPPDYTIIDGTLTDVTGTGNIFCEDQSRTVWFVSLQDEWSFARNWELTAGVRYDHYSDFGPTANPRIALVWETTPSLTSKLLYGEAFRAPSFAELYNKNNPSNQGNPDLDPETIRTVELGFDYQPSQKFRSILSLFVYDIDDLIELVGGANKIAENYRDQEGYGFELEAAWQIFSDFQIKGNVAYQHSEDKDTGLTVADAPAWQAYLNGHWDFLPEWSLDMQYYWIGDRHRNRDPMVGDFRDEIDDYSLVNLVLRRKNIADHIDLALLVRNLLNEDVREPSQIFIFNDYPMEGRSIFGELRVHF